VTLSGFSVANPYLDRFTLHLFVADDPPPLLPSSILRGVPVSFGLKGPAHLVVAVVLCHGSIDWLLLVHIDS